MSGNLPKNDKHSLHLKVRENGSHLRIKVSFHVL